MRKYKIKRFLYEHYITLQPSSVSGNFSAKKTIEYFSREVPFPMGDFMDWHTKENWSRLYYDMLSFSFSL